MATKLAYETLPASVIKKQYALGFKLAGSANVGGSASGNLSGITLNAGASASGKFDVPPAPKISKEGNIVIRSTKKIIRGLGSLWNKAPWYVKAYVGAAILAQGVVIVGGLCYLALTKLGGLPTLSALWNGAVSTFRFVYNFNWNITDKEIDEQIEASLKNLYGLLGAATGSAMGYITCGAIPGAVTFAFNKTLGAAVLRNLSEEAKDEVMGHVAALAWASSRTLVNAAALRMFKGARRWLKKKDSPQYRVLKDIIGEENLKKWGEEGTPAYSFSGDIEKRVEKIPDERLRTFTEEFLEEFGEACVEAGYTVTNTIESYLAAQKMMQDEAKGEERVVEIEFNRAEPAKK